MNPQFKPLTEFVDQIKTGDVLAIENDPKKQGPILAAYSLAIKVVTGGPVTHVALFHDTDNGLEVSETVERGFVFTRLSEFLGHEDEHGWLRAWWLPLSAERRERLDESDLEEEAVWHDDNETPYDLAQAVLSAFDRTARTHNDYDVTKMFCSEWVGHGLQVSGVIRDSNPSEMTPVDMACRFDLYDMTRASQFYGPPLEREFFTNDVNPDGWDQ